MVIDLATTGRNPGRAVTITNGGAGYTSANVSFSDTTTGHGATATVTVSGESVDTIVMTDGGNGYTSATIVTITDTTLGTGATAVTSIDGNGSITSITITNGGSGYTSEAKAFLSPDNHIYNKTYDPDPLTQSTQFRYWVRPSGTNVTKCGDEAVGDTIIYNLLSPLNPGNITPDTFLTTQCLTYDPPAFTINPTGATGEYDYFWYSSPDSSTWIPAGGGKIYNHPAMLDTTYFMVIVDPTGTPDCPLDTSNNTVRINIGASYPANAGLDTSICSTDYLFPANTPEVPGTGEWTLINGSGIFSPDKYTANATISPLEPGINTFEWEITTPLCRTTRDTIVVTRYEEPDDAIIDPAVITLCGDDSVMLHALPVTVPGATGAWTRVNGNGDVQTPGSNDTWVLNLLSGFNEFQWATANGVCTVKKDTAHVFTTIFPGMVWNGSISDDWNDPLNWGCDSIPGIVNIVDIPDVTPLGGFLPIIRNGNVGICKEITIAPAASIVVKTKARLGVYKDFVWANAGNDLTVCSNEQPFQIGRRMVLGAEAFTEYSWSPSFFLGNDTTSPKPLVAFDSALVNSLLDTVTFVDYILTATHKDEPATNWYKDTVRVSIARAPVAATGLDVAYCSTPVQIGASPVGSNTYTWTPTAGLDPASGYTANPTAAPFNTSTYKLKEFDPGTGCKDSNYVTVTVVAAPSATVLAVPDEICTGISSNLTFSMTGTGPWDVIYTTNGINPDTLDDITNSSGNSFSTGVLSNDVTYQITEVTDEGIACFTSSGGSEVVTVHPIPSVYIDETDNSGSANNDSIICSGSNATLTAVPNGGTGSYSYLWSPTTNLSCTNCANPSASPSSTTKYVVTVTDAKGCFTSDSVTIVVHDNPTVSIAPASVVFCNGGSAGLTASASGGIPGYSYAWNPSTNLSCSNCTNPTADPSSTTDYQVVVTDAKSCTGSAIRTVTVNPLPTPSIAGTNSVCINAAAVTYSAPFSSGHTYQWSVPADASITATNGNGNAITVTFGTTNPSVITVTETITLSSCENTVTYPVAVNPKPTVSITEDDNSGVADDDNVICNGASASLAATPSGGTSSYTYSWSTTATSQNINVSTSPPSEDYSVTVTDSKGCKDTADITITSKALPSMPVSEADNSEIANNDGTICNGDFATLTAGGGVTYIWDNSLPAIAGPHNVSPAVSTPYNVTVTNSDSCSTNFNYVVTVTSVPLQPTWVLFETVACTGSDAVTYSVNGAGGTYNWTISGATPATGTGSSIVVDFSGSTQGVGTVTIDLTETNPATNCTSGHVASGCRCKSGDPASDYTPA